MKFFIWNCLKPNYFDKMTQAWADASLKHLGISRGHFSCICSIQQLRENFCVEQTQRDVGVEVVVFTNFWQTSESRFNAAHTSSDGCYLDIQIFRRRCCLDFASDLLFPFVSKRSSYPQVFVAWRWWLKWSLIASYAIKNRNEELLPPLQLLFIVDERLNGNVTHRLTNTCEVFFNGAFKRNRSVLGS